MRHPPVAFINYHVDMQSLSTTELKKSLRDKNYLNVETYAKIQDELLRRGEGYYS